MNLQQRLVNKVRAIKEALAFITPLKEIPASNFHPIIRSIVQREHMKPCRREVVKQIAVSVPWHTNHPELYGANLYDRDNLGMGYTHHLKPRYWNHEPKANIEVKRNYYHAGDIRGVLEHDLAELHRKIDIQRYFLSLEIEDLQKRLAILND